MSARLLFDQNLAPRLARDLADLFPDSAHVRDLNLQTANDQDIWAQADDHGQPLQRGVRGGRSLGATGRSERIDGWRRRLRDTTCDHSANPAGVPWDVRSGD